MKNGLLLFFFLSVFSSCYKSYQNLLVADSYNENTNQSNLSIIPYGQINIPGKWEKTHYNQNSRQYHFDNEDSVTLAVTLNPQDKYSFYLKNMTDSSFVRAFYKWEKDYYEKQGVKINKVEEAKNYLIWTAQAEGVHSMFLFGSKKGIVYNLGFLDNLWPDAKKQAFLKQLFENN